MFSPALCLVGAVSILEVYFADCKQSQITNRTAYSTQMFWIRILFSDSQMHTKRQSEFPGFKHIAIVCSHTVYILATDFWVVMLYPSTFL